jgi:hypothetical protein
MEEIILDIQLVNRPRARKRERERERERERASERTVHNVAGFTTGLMVLS